MKWKRYQTQLDTVPLKDRKDAKEYAERLLSHGREPDDAVRVAIRRYGGGRTRRNRKVTSADVSLARPHGPEGESHGGRGGRDPLRVVEDSTPAGTNAYSKTRASPASARRRRRGGRLRAWVRQATIRPSAR